ncbi:two component system sensor histidine kinase, FIST domain [Desulfosarcina variabilis str. Montpellier]|uniref:PAS domain S-box protein n=1 Tax=Desulfosarcina variabilis TaxID=2300 RepID=UPI003AFACE6F
MANESALIEVGYGRSSHDQAYTAGENAARQAFQGTSRYPLTVVFVFTSVCYDISSLLSGIAHIVGDVPILGTTTAGEICNTASTNSVLVIALASPYLHLRSGVGRHVSADWQRAAAQALETDDLTPYFSGYDNPIWSELTRRGKSVFGLVFTPGNTRHADSRSFEILEMLKQRSVARVPFFGGASADDWNMEANAVIFGKKAYPDSLLVAIFETSLRVGISIGHGFTPSDKQTVATVVEGHEVVELDAQPAADRYAQLLGYDREALTGKHLTLSTGRPVGIRDRLGQHYINVASFFSDQGGVRFSQPVVQGSRLTLMESSSDRLIQAGRETLRRALLRGGIDHPAVVFVFSCALRSHFMQERYPEEISAMQDLLPHSPILGFYSFGEQGVSDAGVSIHGNGMIAALVIGDELSVAAEVAEANARLLEQQQAAEKQLHLQATILSAIKDTIIVISPQMQTLWCNQTAREFFGDREEMFSDPCYWFYKHRSEPCNDCPAIKAMTTGHTHQAISQSYDKNDRPVWRLNRAYPYYDENGQIAGAIEVVSDYSEQKRIQDALQNSELTLKRAQTVAGVGSWLLDAVNNVLNWSDETYRLFGVEKSTPLTIGTFIRCVHPDDRKAVTNAWQAALKGAPYDIEHRIMAGDQERWVHEKAKITFDGDGEPLEAIGTIQDITARKNAEIALAEERRMFIGGPTMVFKWLNTPGWPVAYASPNVQQILGYSPEMLIAGQPAYETLVHPQDLNRAMADMTTHIEAGDDYFEHRPYRLRKRDGSCVWVADFTTIVKSSSGAIQYFLGYLVDITALKHYEALIQAERDLGAAWSGARTFHDRLKCCLEVAIRVSSMDCGGIYLVDENDGSLILSEHQGLPDDYIRRVTYFATDSENARLIKKGRPVYSSHRDLIAKYLKRPVVEVFGAIGMIPVLFDNRVVACLNVASTTLEQIPGHSREALERIARYAGAFIAREIQEEKNRQSRRDLDMLFNTVEDMIFILDRNGCIIQCNRIVLDKLGYSNEDLIGRPIHIVHPPDRHREVREVIAAMLSGDIDTCSIPLKTQDGRQISVETKVKVGLWNGQDAIYEISRDITERIRVEEQRQQMVKAESLACMAGAIAHHFNNALTAVIGNLDLARDALLPYAKVEKKLIEAEKAAHRAAEMSRRMLTFLGQIHSRPETVDLAGICHKHLAQTKHRLPTGVVMNVDLPAKGPLITGDPLLLNQVLDILLVNAIEVLSGEKGMVSVAVNAIDANAIQDHNRFPVQWQPSMDRYACLMVRDNGKGMKKNKIGRIFDPFYSDKFPGRGMGLAVALGIVKSLDGCIQVTSAPYQGSEFRIFLPLMEASDTPTN